MATRDRPPRRRKQRRGGRAARGLSLEERADHAVHRALATAHFSSRAREIVKELETGMLRYPRDVEEIENRGFCIVHTRGGELRIRPHPFSSGTARVLPWMRFVDPHTGKQVLELSFGPDGSVCVTYLREGAAGEEIVVRSEGLEGIIAPSSPIFADLVAHPKDVVALIYRQLCVIGEVYRDHYSTPPAKLERYTTDERRWAVLRAAEELELRHGKEATNVAIARSLGLAESTVRRLRAEAKERFNVGPRALTRDEELKQLIRESKADDRSTRRRGVLPYRENAGEDEELE